MDAQPASSVLYQLTKQNARPAGIKYFITGVVNMKKTWHTPFALALVLLFGLSLFYIGTDGFKAYTAETARVNSLIENQPQFPEVTFEDSKGRVYPVSEFDGKYVFITFMYTYCSTVCPILEMNMGQVYSQVPEEYIGEDILFLSISFDPERDDPATLAEYTGHFNADGDTWRMARINDQEELDSACLKSSAWWLSLMKMGILPITQPFTLWTEKGLSLM